MPDPAAKAVFLSYSRDDLAAARRIAEALRSRGVQVWFDENELHGGDAWDAKIRQQINDCTLFIPIISQQTESRLKAYFRLEWKLAVDQTHLLAEGVPFITPVVIDDTRESGAVVPPEFMRVQWTRLPGGLPSPQFLDRVQRLLASPTAATPSTTRTANPPPPPQPAKRPRYLFPLAAVAGAALLAITVFLFLRPAAKEAPTAAKIGDKSIAVLPFVNLGADKADEYLGDGMTEELLNVLAKVKGLRVPGRTSSFAFKGKTDEDIFRKVGEKLRVSTVLEGSVRKTGNQLRITTQLINVADGFHIWSETYDRDATNILAVQTEVARRVVSALQAHLGFEAGPALAATSTTNPAAYEFYLRGRFHFFKMSETDHKVAIGCFTKALELDPTYARAYAGLAAVYAEMSSYAMAPAEAMPLARQHVSKALELDDSLADAHHILAQVKWWGDWDFPGAEREFRRALELNPHEGDIYRTFGVFLSQQLRHEESLALARKGATIDDVYAGLPSSAYFYMRQFDQAYAAAQAAMSKAGSIAIFQGLLADICTQLGRHDEAIAAAREAARLSTDPRAFHRLAKILARAGKPEEARRYLKEFEELSTRKYISPVRTAEVYIVLGETDRAFEFLQKGYEDRSDHLLWLQVSPDWDRVRTDPRFVELVQKIGLPRR